METGKQRLHYNLTKGFHYDGEINIFDYKVEVYFRVICFDIQSILILSPSSIFNQPQSK